jgi:hypothetical protein
MPMPQLPRQPWMGQGQPQQKPQMTGQPQQPGMPQRPGQPKGKPNAAQIHAQLDAKEQQLKQELKQLQAVRTLMEAKGHKQQPAGAQPQQPGARPPGR